MPAGTGEHLSSERIRVSSHSRLKAGSSAHLLIAVHEVHEAVVVVVVVRALGRVDGQQQVVGAQAVALRVRIAEDARLQQLVV